MTTRLRYIGASIMGILDPNPSPTPSTMSDTEGAWVRAHAWTEELQRIEDAYPHGFHRWCSCERGTCTSCAAERHDQCISASGPRIDTDAGTVTDRRGFVVALIQYKAGERPCRWICPCTHPSDVDTAEKRPAVRPTPPSSRAEPDPDGQLSLFGAAAMPLKPGNGQAQ
ncbi:DUF6248 family natural product biosynthesis protein [Streptomyces xanthochromogenes]|uniref:DUF6248 family natural product biosynthesis protein n=1 Tax=Streptomyces xanthochromogenes TaxID=67384 RepID=UPI0034260BD5